jgi:hypothetical protein
MNPVVVVVLVLFVGLCWWRIAGKAGFNPWLGLLMLVPVLNLAFLGWLAFAEWPLERRASRVGDERAGNDDHRDGRDGRSPPGAA